MPGKKDGGKVKEGMTDRQDRSTEGRKEGRKEERGK
jgi:hypothetical protein